MEVCSWGWVAPCAWVPCCSANLKTRVAAAAAAAGLDSSYWKTQQEGAWPVRWVVLGWGWQTEEEYGMLDFPLGAWTTTADPEQLGRRWVVDQTGRR